MKVKYIIGALLIAMCLGVGVFSLRSSLTPYVGFEEARASERKVQVAGALVKETSTFDRTTGMYTFILTNDEGAEMKVETAQQLPANFEQSTTVVAIGSYKETAFIADRILVKCPSKYDRDAMDDKHPGQLPAGESNSAPEPAQEKTAD